MSKEKHLLNHKLSSSLHVFPYLNYCAEVLHTTSKMALKNCQAGKVSRTQSNFIFEIKLVQIYESC